VSSGSFLLDAHDQSWPLEKVFRISRGASTETRVVVVSISDGEHTGRGEAVPIKRYAQTVASTLEQIESVKTEKNLDRARIQQLLPPGAARNALDCAFWDFEAKVSGKRAWELANIAMLPTIETAFTISLDSPDAMAAAAKANTNVPILKLKLGGDDVDLARVEAVREAAPAARLLIDANESWSPAHYREIAAVLRDLRVELIEQPFPADTDQILEDLDHLVPVCADESCHTSADLPRLMNRYEMVNIKLDKTGGLTEAILLAERARQIGLKLLVGCMVCTSLGTAPARLLASAADYVDLDGPLLLAGDRHHGLSYQDGKIGIPARELWG
jgi:L-Ala-D/L-Glu epimerase